jgi:hypothetical protein
VRISTVSGSYTVVIKYVYRQPQKLYVDISPKEGKKVPCVTAKCSPPYNNTHLLLPKWNAERTEGEEKGPVRDRKVQRGHQPGEGPGGARGEAVLGRDRDHAPGVHEIVVQDVVDEGLF